MSIEALPAEIAEAPAARRPAAWRKLARNPSVVIGAVIVIFLALVGLLAPVLGTIDPSEINPVYRNKKPGVERTIRSDDGKETVFVHRFGTDSLGRDIYSRVVYGARVSLLIGITVAAISVAIGLTIGLIAGYIRWLDNIIMRFMDGLMAIPAILLAMGVVSLSRAGLIAEKQNSAPQEYCRRDGSTLGAAAADAFALGACRSRQHSTRAKESWC